MTKSGCSAMPLGNKQIGVRRHPEKKHHSKFRAENIHMSKRFLILAAVALVSLTVTSGSLWARGFGGGGFHGGGFHGGDFGGYRGGDFGADRGNFGGGDFRGADDGYRGYRADGDATPVGGRIAMPTAATLPIAPRPMAS